MADSLVAMRLSIFVVLAVAAFGPAAMAQPSCARPADLNDQWQVTEPATVGLDEGKLCALKDRFAQWPEANLHGVIVARRGKLAFETYFTGYDQWALKGPATVEFDATTLHDPRSATKSITALVAGVAVDRGIVPGIDRTVLSFFPDYADLATAEKERITVRHLLTMSAGLKWDDDAPYTNENAMNKASDPYRYVLSLPVAAPPGTVFNYSGGNTALIAGVLQRASGQRFDALATALLLEPLGISNVAWRRLPNGDPKSWCCMLLRPRDMAKMGQLVLDRGRWQGQRVLSESWMEAATSLRISTPSGLGYGYQFWLGQTSTPGGQVDWVAARGQGGQRIFIVPKMDLVAVITAGNYYGKPQLSALVPRMVFEDYVLPSVVNR
jgi:CubicO group peptidase (beta-lactamase class C family)